MEIFNNPDIFEDQTAVINYLLIHAAFLFCLFNVLFLKKKIKTFRYLKGKIVGYRHSLYQTGKKDTYESHFKFHPIIKADDLSDKIIVKQLCILKPEGHKVQGYINSKDKFISPTTIAHPLAVFLLVFMGAISINSLLFFPKYSITIIDYTLPTIAILSLAVIMHGAYKHIKNTGSFSILNHEINWPQRPQNYDLMTEDDFESIKNKDICTYEEVKAYHYHQNQHGKLYAYLAYAVAIIGIVFALLLMTQTIKF